MGIVGRAGEVVLGKATGEAWSSSLYGGECASFSEYFVDLTGQANLTMRGATMIHTDSRVGAAEEEVLNYVIKAMTTYVLVPFFVFLRISFLLCSSLAFYRSHLE